MISDALFEAASIIREYLEDPSFKDIYAGELRKRIEDLVVEMDSVRSLPGMDRAREAETIDLRTEALEQMHMEDGLRREDEEEEARARTEAIERVKSKPGDLEQNGEPDDDQWCA